MKTLILFSLSLMATGLYAQNTPETPSEKMRPFEHWVGQWKGEGSMQRGPGGAEKSAVEENISFKLNGTILVVEGIGKKIDPQTSEEKIVHHAFGILNFDQVSGEYKFQSYLSDGKSSPAWFKVLPDNRFQWGFDVPGGKIRYSITIDPEKNTWFETGEFSRDENTWLKFFEMQLTKV